jgi:ABC-type sugar transport system ATPase subunit
VCLTELHARCAAGRPATVIYVTHDQTEARPRASALVPGEGVIQQVDTLYRGGRQRLAADSSARPK